MWLYVSIGFNVLFMVLLGGALFLLNRAGQAIRNYEAFYQQTLSDLEKHMSYVQTLMRNNVILSDDDDVKKVFKSIKSFYQLMLGYFNAGNGPAVRSRTQDKEELLRERD